MISPIAASLIAWTARTSIAGWLVVAVRDLGRSPEQPRDIARWPLLIWTVACTSQIVHVLLAFHFVHHWSHADAIRVTAERTAAIVGWAYGGGVYWNHGFLLIWLMDVIYRWRMHAARQPRTIVCERTVHGVFAFMFFNATVVFGPRGYGIAAAIVLPAAIAILIAMRSHQRR